MCSSFDQTQRQFEPLAKQALAAVHLAGVSFVIVAGQVQQSVQHQNLDLCSKGVSLRSCLAAGSGNTDGEVSGQLDGGPAELLGGKRENIGCLVFAAEVAIEPADAAICGEQHRYLATKADSSLRFTQKARKRAHRWDVAGGFGRGGERLSVRIQVLVKEDHRARAW